ncbi:MAG: NAD(P)/FAD-dependent oxidoreductase [Candidatus Latescibacterota bacterium]
MAQYHYDLVVIGAGPAGLMAAIESHRAERKSLILEKMPHPAMKLKISGKGRCNLTNEARLADFIAHFGKNGRFLKYAFAEFFSRDLLDYFEDLGIRFRLERGGRYFPSDENAADVANALLEKTRSLRIPLWTDAEVLALAKSPDQPFALTVAKGKGGGPKDSQRIQLTADHVVLATGGKSYPKTGSDGAGYSLAARLGHTITPLSPSLVPIDTKGDTAKRLEGLSLKNARASVWCNNKKVEERFGEMVFTHSGVSGPIILSLSKTVVQLIDANQAVSLSIDLKPALDAQVLDQRLLREIAEHSRQGFKNLLKNLLPKSLIPVFADLTGIPEDKPLNQITADERKKLARLLKDFPFEVAGYRSIAQAIVTSGGVAVNEIDPKTMESRLVKGLYFAGEIIDLDADTGGFNLQAAFSTGWVAGRALRRIESETGHG